MHVAFRVGPSIPAFKKLKAHIDSGARAETVLSNYKDPHLFTAMMKYYLRELPDPLFCSVFKAQWTAINNIKDQWQRKKEIENILNMIPEDNRRNIEFLFDFLAQLLTEEVSNKMSINNLLLVLGPNLLWDEKSMKPVNIPNVYTSLIERSKYKCFMGENDIYKEGHSTTNKPIKSKELQNFGSSFVENVPPHLLKQEKRETGLVYPKSHDFLEKNSISSESSDPSLSPDLLLIGEPPNSPVRRRTFSTGRKQRRTMLGVPNDLDRKWSSEQVLPETRVEEEHQENMYSGKSDEGESNKRLSA